MPRLFTGIEIPPDVGQALTGLRGGLPGARWIDPENYHITLRFIGDVDDVAAREVAFVLGGVKRAPFEVRIAGVDSFGGRKPRAVFVSADGGQPLIDMQAAHVTLARLRQSSSRDVAEYLAAHGLFRIAPFTVTRFVLFSSRASVGGGPYVVEAAYPLSTSS